MGETLGSQARRFAKQTSDLLNGTVTNGVRISTLTTSTGDTIMGAGVRKTSPDARPIPMAIAGDASVFLYLVHTYGFDPESEYLTMMSSTLSVYTSNEMKNDHLVVGIDYVRDPTNQYPGSHLHVHGERSDLDAIYLGNDRSSRSLRDLHLPVGGRRFRPTLEDLIVFMVTEEMVEPREGWADVVDEHGELWEAIQLKAAVRRYPEVAAEALKNENWTVAPPS